MKENGYILLHRDLMENWVWQDEIFTKGQAWVDLLMLVNHSDNDKVLINNKFISVKRGETITSKLKLAKRWGWSRKKLDKFLGLLERDGMATTESTPHYTTIKVLNYNVYQTNKKDFAQRNAQQKEQPKEQQKHNGGSNGGTQTINDLNNELNNDNQLKDIVPYKKLVDYINKLTGKSWTSTAKKTQQVIKARFNEGYTYEQAISAIDESYKHWSKSGELDNMHPTVIFNGKFERRIDGGLYSSFNNKQDKPKTQFELEQEQIVKDRYSKYKV